MCFFMLLEAGTMLDKPGNKLMFHNITTRAESSSKYCHCPPLYLRELHWGLKSGSVIFQAAWERSSLCNSPATPMQTVFKSSRHFPSVKPGNPPRWLSSANILKTPVTATSPSQRHCSSFKVPQSCMAASYSPVSRVLGHTGTHPFKQSSL